MSAAARCEPKIRLQLRVEQNMLLLQFNKQNWKCHTILSFIHDILLLITKYRMKNDATRYDEAMDRMGMNKIKEFDESCSLCIFANPLGYVHPAGQPRDNCSLVGGLPGLSQSLDPRGNACNGE